jgi:hypothetical protein
MVENLMSNELAEAWKEVTVAYLRCNQMSAQKESGILQ